MIYKNIELFNVDEVIHNSDNSGVLLSRFPSDVIDTLKGRGAYISRSTTGCEIRFVTDAKTIWLTMESVVNDTALTVYCGDFVYQKLLLKAGVKTTFELHYNECFDKVENEFFKTFEKRYPINLWRVYINDEGSHCIFHDIKGLDGIIRPPFEKEKPAKKWLAYGSSITHGCWAPDTTNSYINHAAKLLNVDVMCKGMSGSCHCEKEMANYLAKADWDFLTLELGVNMFGFKTKEFKKRVQYLIETVHEKNPDKKVFVITPYMNFTAFGKDKDGVEKHEDYTKILSEITENIHSENLILIKGDEILDSPTYLCYDLLHPSEYGHVRMGVNLAEIIKKSLKKK